MLLAHRDAEDRWSVGYPVTTDWRRPIDMMLSMRPPDGGKVFESAAMEDTLLDGGPARQKANRAKDMLVMAKMLMRLI